MVLLFTEARNGGNNGVGKGEFIFGHVECEVPVRH